MGCAQTSQIKDIHVVFGPLIGDVSKDCAIIWARASSRGFLTLKLTEEKRGAEKASSVFTIVFKENCTGTLLLQDLKEDTSYRFEIGTRRGSFRTGGGNSTKIVWGSCLGGQSYGIRKGFGIPLISKMKEQKPNGFVFLGDTIYADDPVPEKCNFVDGWNNDSPQDFVCKTREQIQRRYEYFLNDNEYASFLSETPVYVTWDDHEVINDWGGAMMMRDNPELLKASVAAFYDNWPITTENTPKSPCGRKIYRHVEMGLCDLFMLDCRQYRSLLTKVEDSPGPPQLIHLLGQEQVDWLVQSLMKSTATWKLIACSVPISIQTGTDSDKVGCDSFANNKAVWELQRVFETLIEHSIKNVVFLSGDVHFPFAFSYELKDGSFVHEFGASPIHALPLPNTPAQKLNDDLPIKSREELYCKGEFGGTGFTFGLLEATEENLQMSFQGTSEILFSHSIQAQ